MCKKSKFDHTNKWYMHNPASVQENDTHKLLWDFDIETDYQISARRPDFIIINKKENLKNCRLCSPGWTRNKTERMWKEGYVLGPFEGMEKNMELEGDNYTNGDWCVWHSHQRIINGTGGLRNKRSGDHPNYCIIENGQNTEKSPGDLWRLAVTQTPVKNYQLKLMWKTLKE